MSGQAWGASLRDSIQLPRFQLGDWSLPSPISCESEEGKAVVVELTVCFVSCILFRNYSAHIRVDSHRRSLRHS